SEGGGVAIGAATAFAAAVIALGTGMPDCGVGSTPRSTSMASSSAGAALVAFGTPGDETGSAAPGAEIGAAPGDEEGAGGTGDIRGPTPEGCESRSTLMLGIVGTRRGLTASA